MSHDVLATMVTTTSYGTWMPGDARGYVENGILLPPSETLRHHASALMTGPAVIFTTDEQSRLFDSLLAAAREFGYRLTDASVESWHLHWIIEHTVDPVATMVGRLKTRMRQGLDRGRIWTVGYWFRYLYSQQEIDARRSYIARHDGCRMSEGRVVPRP